MSKNLSVYTIIENPIHDPYSRVCLVAARDAKNARLAAKNRMMKARKPNAGMAFFLTNRSMIKKIGNYTGLRKCAHVIRYLVW